MFGPKKQILLIGNDGVQLYTVSGKRVAIYADFSESGASLSSDLRTAFRTVGLPLVLVLDVAEQQYRKESIPNINFMDRGKVIRRKLEMAFPQQQMRAFIQLKPRSNRDTGIVALFAGLSPTLTVTQVMDAILGSEVNVEGAVLLPIESTGLVSALVAAANKKPASARWSVLMTKHKTGGLRQVVIKDDELALTRLTPFVSDPYNRNAVAEEIGREFNATLTYLARFGYVPADGLDLVVVGSEDVCDAVRAVPFPVTNLHAVTPFQAARLVGLTITQAGQSDGFGEALHAGWIGTRRKTLMPLSAPLLDKIRQARQIARVVMLAAIAGGAYMAFEAFTLWGGNAVLQREIADSQSRRVVLQNEHDTKAKELNTLTLDPEKTRVILGIHDSFAKKNLALEPMISGIMAMTDRSAIIPEKFDVKPLVSTDLNAPPSSDLRAAISLTIGFAPHIALDQAAILTRDFSEKLRTRFPGRKVSIVDIAGNLALDKTVQGLSERIDEKGSANRHDAEFKSTLLIEGALE